MSQDEYVKVHNLNNTSDRTPPDNSDTWKSYWEKQKPGIFLFCCNKDCYNFAEVGAHVQKDNESTEDSWYIVPLCKKCNKISKRAFLVSSEELVPIRK